MRFSPDALDFFLPPGLRDDTERLGRARVTVRLAAVFVATAFVYAGFYGGVVGFATGTVIVAVGGGLAVALLGVLRVTGRVRLVSHAITFLLYAVLVGLMVHMGGLASVVTPWLVTPPMLAVLLVGGREATPWGALCLLTAAACWAAEAAGVRFPVGYAAAWTTLITAVSFTGLIACTGAVLFVFEAVRARAQAHVAAAHAALGAAHEELARQHEHLQAQALELEMQQDELLRQGEALRESEARHRLLFAKSPLPMWVYDVETLCFLAVNDAAIAKYGWSREEFLAMALSDIRQPADVAALRADVAAMPAGLKLASEWRHRTRAGAVLDVSITSHAIQFDGREARLVLAADVTARKAAEAALAHRAYHDALTGLANRAQLRDRLACALADAAAAGRPESVAALVVDLDGFKLVNDSMGHQAGDALLVEVAARLRAATRGSDLVARLGGDEFAVLLTGVGGEADVAVVAERILAALQRPVMVPGMSATVGASIGMARGSAAPQGVAPQGEARQGVAGESVEGRAPADAPDDAVAPGDALLRDADLALYAAKAQGKGVAAWFAPAMHTAAVSRLALEAALRRGLAHGEFFLAYQPAVDLATGALTSIEALARWRDPARGLVPPTEFIPLAEETGLIHELGRWVLEEACRQGAAWRGAHPAAADLTVAVNVSGRQLQRAEFVGEVEAALGASGFPPERLVLELTESTVIHHPEMARQRLAALKALGVHLAIDDFGTGYSALSYLRQFPIDVLKIDKSFVDSVAAGGRPAALAAAIVALGDALGLRTVAEGVESAEQAAALERAGCALAQGYHFAPPLPPEAVDALLAGPPAPDAWAEWSPGAEGQPRTAAVGAAG
jgi:diguanylate cyclase (GGDEF)-like protein/PAS domain S-box-containing protein